MRRGAVYSSPMGGRIGSARAITVTVTFFADLRRFLPRGTDGPQRHTLSGNATIADLLALIGVAPDADVTAAVDGELADRETVLHEGADVMLLESDEWSRRHGTLRLLEQPF